MSAPEAGYQAIWFVTAELGQLDLLRAHVAMGHHLLIDAESGVQPVDPFDLVLVRTGDDRFEAIGCASPLLAQGQWPRDLTGHLLAALSTSGQQAHDLLCIAAPSGRQSLLNGEGTPLESLFEILRGPEPGFSLAARRQLCLTARANLDASHDLLNALLLVQQARLELLAGVSHSATEASVMLRPVRHFALRRLHAAYFHRPPRYRAAVGDLFGAEATAPRPRDTSFALFRAQAIRIPLRAEAICRDFSTFVSPCELHIDEARLADFLAPAVSRRITASTSLAGPRTIEVGIDWEVRQSFSRLLPLASTRPSVNIRLESVKGNQIGLAKRVKLGDRLYLDLPCELFDTDGVEGRLAYSLSIGHWSRHSFRHAPWGE